MKTLFFDCASGISGNMVLGALLELVGDEQYLLDELKKLNIDGYKIEINKKMKNGINGTHVNVIVDGEDEYGHVHHIENHGHEHHHEHENENDHEHHHEHEHSHEHESEHKHEHSHHHSHRNLNDIENIINTSLLSAHIKELAKRIFMRVAKAEAKVHNKPLQEVHFHEVGATDSIIDIVGTAILIDKINPDKIISSIINEGYGFIQCAHGQMAVPVPATTEIFADAHVKFRQIDINTELVTPTGAAIIVELSSDFVNMPEMEINKIGWGSGTKDLKIPNVLKVILGNINSENDDVIIIESNIDDSSSEILGYTEELLFNEGALDVFFTPIYMKKNRPAYKLTVIAKEEDFQKLTNIIFRETTTIGIRYRKENRVVLKREFIEVDTKYGKVTAKKVIHNGNEYVYPEYEELKRIAKEKDIPIKLLYKLDELN